MECKFCHQNYVPIRSDQEFCTQKCRFDYHNAEAKKIRDRCKNTIAILQQNLAILDKLLANKNEKITNQDILKSMGYKLNYFTNFEKLGDISYTILFDIQIEVLNKQQLKIKRL